MAISDVDVYAKYLADGATTQFPIAHAITSANTNTPENEVEVYLVDESVVPAVETLQALVTDYNIVGSNVVFVVAPLALPIAYKVYVGRKMVLDQAAQLDPGSKVPVATIELGLDKLTAIVQLIGRQLARAPKFRKTYEAITDLFFPEPPSPIGPRNTIVWNAAGTGLELGPSADAILDAEADAAEAEASAAAAALSAAAAAAAAASAAATLAAIGAAGPFDDTLYGYSGFSARFGEAFATAGLKATLDQIIEITYTAPTVSLAASGSGSLREKGTVVASSNLSATVTKKSDPIAAVRFYFNGVLVNTVASPNPAGGVETYSWAGSFSDTPATFSVQVDDNGATGGPSTVSSSASFSFVYPYYYGAGAVGLTPAQVAALTKLIAPHASRTLSIAATNGQVFYYAFPAAYGALSSILDVNGFETITDWTVTTANITGLDATAQSYKIYEFNNPVVVGSYQYTFI